MIKERLFSVTAADCTWQTFTVGGHGGAGKDTSNSGVRCVHMPSGAVGKGTEHRQQTLNRRAAFKRMAETPVFKFWCRAQAAFMRGEPSLDERVDVMMEGRNLLIESQDENGIWQKEL